MTIWGVANNWILLLTIYLELEKSVPLEYLESFLSAYHFDFQRHNLSNATQKSSQQERIPVQQKTKFCLWNRLHFKDTDGKKNCLEPFTCVDLLKWRKLRTLRREATAKRKKENSRKYCWSKIRFSILSNKDRKLYLDWIVRVKWRYLTGRFIGLHILLEPELALAYAHLFRQAVSKHFPAMYWNRHWRIRFHRFLWLWESEPSVLKIAVLAQP